MTTQGYVPPRPAWQDNAKAVYLRCKSLAVAAKELGVTPQRLWQVLKRDCPDVIGARGLTRKHRGLV